MFCSVNQLFTDCVKSWKSEYCSVEFQLKVGGTRVVEGLGTSAFKALVSSAIVTASPMTAEVQRTNCTDTVSADQGCLVQNCRGCLPKYCGQECEYVCILY